MSLRKKLREHQPVWDRGLGSPKMKKLSDTRSPEIARKVSRIRLSSSPIPAGETTPTRIVPPFIRRHSLADFQNLDPASTSSISESELSCLEESDLEDSLFTSPPISPTTPDHEAGRRRGSLMSGLSTNSALEKQIDKKRRTSVLSMQGFHRFSPKTLLEFVHDNVIGLNAVFHGPFGKKRVVYCDYTASGKALACIEEYIQEEVHPLYGIGHHCDNNTSFSSAQTAGFLEDARDIIKKSVNASDNDAVIFCGSGATGAIHKLLEVLQIKGERAAKTIIIVGPFEHHSNILPWKEAGTKVVRIRCDRKSGLVDMIDLNQKLKFYCRLGFAIVGAFSATSNVTGIITDTVSVAELIHKYGGLSVWDYATGAPYLKIDMNPSKMGYKDAVFFSPHKFIGGVGTPGVLIAKKNLFVKRNLRGFTIQVGDTEYKSDPCFPDKLKQIDGEVRKQNKRGKNIRARGIAKRDNSLTENDVIYKKSVPYIENMEEQGTQNIIGCVRAGLVFQLKEAIGTELIANREEELCAQAFTSLKTNVNIYILGSHTAKRLPIFPLLFRNKQSGKLLHPNFVVTLLNDLYGIQARGGCACAGPYTQELLGICEDVAQTMSWFLTPPTDGTEVPGRSLRILKPGFVRLNLPYFVHQYTVNFILHAIDAIASDGWKLLPLYTYNPKTGDWKHRKPKIKLRSLFDISFQSNGVFIEDNPYLSPNDHISLKMVADQAAQVLENPQKYIEKANLDPELDFDGFPLSDEDKHVIWFLLPYQAYLYLSFPILKILTPRGNRSVISPHRNTIKRVRRRYRRLIQAALGDAKEKRSEVMARSAVFDDPSEAQRSPISPERDRHSGDSLMLNPSPYSSTDMSKPDTHFQFTLTSPPSPTSSVSPMELPSPPTPRMPVLCMDTSPRLILPPGTSVDLSLSDIIPAISEPSPPAYAEEPGAGSAYLAPPDHREPIALGGEQQNVSPLGVIGEIDTGRRGSYNVSDGTVPRSLMSSCSIQ